MVHIYLWDILYHKIIRQNDTYIRQDTLLSIFRRVLEALHVKWRNSTPRFCLDTRGKKWKYKSKLFFYIIEWGSNPQPVDFTVTLCAPARDQWWKNFKNRLTFEDIVSKILEERELMTVDEVKEVSRDHSVWRSVLFDYSTRDKARHKVKVYILIIDNYIIRDQYKYNIVSWESKPTKSDFVFTLSDKIDLYIISYNTEYISIFSIINCFWLYKYKL